MPSSFPRKGKELQKKSTRNWIPRRNPFESSSIFSFDRRFRKYACITRKELSVHVGYLIIIYIYIYIHEQEIGIF
jgi:hypothetical protein